MLQAKDLRSSLVDLVTDYATSRGASVDDIVEELDRVRALAPEIVESPETDPRTGSEEGAEHPAIRLERLFRLASERGLRGTRAMDLAARHLAIWNAHPSAAAGDLLDQLSRCADAVELLIARRAS